MARPERLIAFLQILRRHRRPVSAEVLASELGVSVRTVYRDVAALIGQGATIEGEAGIGYVLRPGFLLPPMMFSDEEIEALVLGSRYVAAGEDEPLANAARHALVKIAAVLPPDLRDRLEEVSLLVVPPQREREGASPSRAGEPGAALPVLRAAIRRETKLALRYRDTRETVSERTVWPIAVGYFGEVRVLAAWCELRKDYRHFRADRIVSMTPLDEPYPRRRCVMLKGWRQRNGIPAPE